MREPKSHRVVNIIKVLKLRRNKRWVGLHWLWNKLWAWRWRDAEYEAWLEQERVEAEAMFKAIEDA